MTDAFRTILVADSQVATARSMAELLGGAAGAGMWTTPLAATASGPATHWISSGYISEPFAAMLPLTAYNEDGEPVVVSEGNAALVAEQATDAGQPTSEQEVQAVFDASNVTMDEPHVAMARLGLVMVQEDIDG